MICYYQCQLEVNGQDQGPVYDNCRCSPTDILPSPTEQVSTLPPQCFSPRGIDCSWYRECLEARYPCESTGDGYAIRYAEKYCTLYNNNFNDFSPSGRMWIDGVRKCLQLFLVPYLRPWVQKSCQDLKNEAFGSHSNCYLNPESAPSICQLPCIDVARAFILVNFEGDALTTEPLETGKQMLEVMFGCFGTFSCPGIIATTVTIVVPGLATIRSARRLLAAGRIGLHIAKSLSFESNGIGWFPFLNTSSSERQRRSLQNVTEDTVMLLLTDLKVLNVSNGSRPLNVIGRQTLEEAVTALTDAVSNGMLSRIPVSLDETAYTFGVSSLGQCSDTFCSDTSNVTLLASGAAKGGLGMPVVLYGLIAMLHALLK